MVFATLSLSKIKEKKKKSFVLGCYFWVLFFLWIFHYSNIFRHRMNTLVRPTTTYHSYIHGKCLFFRRNIHIHVFVINLTELGSCDSDYSNSWYVKKRNTSLHSSVIITFICSFNETMRIPI